MSSPSGPAIVRSPVTLPLPSVVLSTCRLVAVASHVPPWMLTRPVVAVKTAAAPSMPLADVKLLPPISMVTAPATTTRPRLTEELRSGSLGVPAGMKTVSLMSGTTPENQFAVLSQSALATPDHMLVVPIGIPMAVAVAVNDPVNAVMVLYPGSASIVQKPAEARPSSPLVASENCGALEPGAAEKETDWSPTGFPYTSRITKMTGAPVELPTLAPPLSPLKTAIDAATSFSAKA